MCEPSELQGKHIVLGLTGGIACYKSAEFVRLLTKAGATVQVVMTEAAASFITPVTMQALSGRPVVTSQWDAREPNNMAHINLHAEADAIVLAKMLVHHALVRAHPAGAGPGPVLGRSGFAAGPRASGAPLPWLGLADELPWRLTAPAAPGNDAPLFRPFTPPADGLYGIAPDSAQLHAALRAGLRCVQLRHKPSEGLGPHLLRSLLDAQESGAQLFVNDHWDALLPLLRQLPATDWPTAPLGLHLGQEDLLKLDSAGRTALLAARDRLMLGLSSHSLWELARAAGCGASLIACGPVQPTTTKHMPWQAQGERNLRWWVANSPAPVAAIGGLLTPDDLARFAACGPAVLCVVRALQHPEAKLTRHVAELQRAVKRGRQQIGAASLLPLPAPVLA